MAIFPNLAPMRIYWHAPAPLFAARVNLPGPILYPLQEIPYDGVTTGTYTDLSADMLFTLGSAAGLDDYGRGRLRAAPTATTLKVGRASQGFEDGQLNLVDNAYITVYADYRVHARIPAIVDFVEYKDADLAVGDFTQEPPPVATMGPDRARRIDAISEVARFFFDGAGSYAVADGATITGYAWDIGDGSYALGTGATDATIYADFPAGVRYVALTVTDSNGKTHTTWRLVLADDPANSLAVSGMQVTSFTRTLEGSTLRLRVLQDLPRSAYPDGAHVLVWEDRDPAIYGTPSPTDWSDVLFTGWHQTDETSSTALETHLRRETELTCVDVAGRLDSLPGFNQRIEIPDDDGVWTWGEMAAPNMDKFLHYLVHWHSTAPSVADFFPSGTWDAYPFVLFDAVGDTLFNQLQRQANRLVPDHEMTCDRYGRLKVTVNPQLQDAADRTTTVQGSLIEQSWQQIEFGYQRPPRVHTVRGSAVLTGTDYLLDGEGNEYLPTAFSIAPGTAPGQGGREATLGERLAQSQEDLNSCVGHHYARMNARYGPITVTPNSNSDPWDYDPAALTWVYLVITAESAPHRGIDFETTRCLCREVSVDYQYAEEATTWRARVELEPETVGLPALTEEDEAALPVGEQPGVFVPPDLNDPDVFYGDIAAYVLWDGTDVLRTWDLQAASPTWERIDTGISGTIWDCQYMMVDADTVGAWLMSDEGIFFCGDLMALSPSWENVLPIATVRATAVAPTSGNVIFGGMTHYWSQPGHLCVAMSLDTEDDDYLHCYYWVTEDYGATWTPVDVTEFTYTSDSLTRCYYRTEVFGLASFRTAPGTIWCLRDNGRTSTSNGDAAVFKSEDLGYTWTKEAIVATQRATELSITHPYPNIDSPCYLMIASGGTTPVERIWKSTDGWATASELTPPASHVGGFAHSGHMMRPNKNPFDDLHALCLFRITASSNADLYETTDGGATWGLLDNLNNSVATPNGWPPDTQQWVLVDDTDAPVIQLTLDNFGTYADKTGNLASVLSGGTWDTSGIANGFALPKVGANA